MRLKQGHQRNASKPSVDFATIFDKRDLSEESTESALQIFSDSIYSGDVLGVIDRVRQTDYLFEFIYSSASSTNVL
jgi:hypothetical protein